MDTTLKDLQKWREDRKKQQQRRDQHKLNIEQSRAAQAKGKEDQIIQEMEQEDTNLKLA